MESEPGVGASFWLIMPPERARPSKPERPEIRVSPARPVVGQPPVSDVGDKIRVMLVDDHEVMRNGLSSLLGINRDIEIVGEVSDGLQAVRQARKILPDVILMDINMPKMDGLEATRRIHAEFPHIRIIVISMYEDQTTASAALNAGAVAFLTKSGSTDRLLAEIRDEAF